jgi:hypothetical protein
MNETEFDLPWDVAQKWINFGIEEIIFRFNLKPPAGYPNYPYYCFVKKNNNRYFRKHLGFSFSKNKEKNFVFVTSIKIKIIDPEKLMIFRLKYGI